MNEFYKKYIDLIRGQQATFDENQLKILYEMNAGSYLLPCIRVSQEISQIILPTEEETLIAVYSLEPQYFVKQNLIEDLGFLCAMSTEALEFLEEVTAPVQTYFMGASFEDIESAIVDQMWEYL